MVSIVLLQGIEDVLSGEFQVVASAECEQQKSI